VAHALLLLAPHHPGVVGHDTILTHGSLRSRTTPQRSSGAPPTAFGGPTLCYHGSQRSTSSWQRSSRAPSTLVDSPLPASYLSTSAPSVYVPSPLVGDLPLSYQSSTPLDLALEASKLTTGSSSPQVLPKVLTADRILRSDKQNQLEELASQGSFCLFRVGASTLLTFVAKRETSDLTVALGRNAFKQNTLGAIDENRTVNPKDLEKQFDPKSSAYPSAADTSIALQPCLERMTMDHSIQNDLHTYDDQVTWPPTALEAPRGGDTLPDTAPSPTLANPTHSILSPASTCPISPDIGAARSCNSIC